MKRILFILISCLFFSQAMAQYNITKKDGVVIQGRVVKRSKDAYAVRTVAGNLVVVQIRDIARIQSGKTLFDLETQIRYRVEKRRPFLPFLLLSGAAAFYSAHQIEEYRKNKKEADDAIFDEDIIYLNDKSKRNMAFSIISGFVSVGTAYIALRPIEVKTPIGPIKLSMGVRNNRVQLSMNF